MQRIEIAALALVALGACRPATSTTPPSTPFDHHRDDYVSRPHEPVGIAVDLVAQLVEAAPRFRSTPSIVIDERLSVVADEVAERTAGGAVVALPELVTIARESGALLFPLEARTFDPNELASDWPDHVLASIAGSGPLAIGTSTPRNGSVVFVFARAIVRLPEPVPASGTTRLEIELDPIAGTMTPALLLVDGEGVTRLAMQQIAPRRFVAERAAGFAGSRVAILGITPQHSVTFSTRRHTEMLASLHLGPAPQIGPPRIDALPEALAAVRKQWGRSAVEISPDVAQPCTEEVLTIAAKPVTLNQLCLTWASAGTDAERWAAMLVNPLALDALADPAWQIAEIRRDPMSTTILFAQRFEDMSEAEAHLRVQALVRARFPAITHDAAADRDTAALAKAWASEPLDRASVDKHATLTAQAGARWSKQPRSYRVTWAAQDLALALENVEPDATPGAYTLGIVRGKGLLGEPRWFMVLLLSLPAA